MILIGYQGIGKSTLASAGSGWIDLESSCFWHDGVRSDDWYKSYAAIAADLNSQGFNVCAASHEVVRRELLKYQIDDIVVCYPSVNLKGEWIKKLRLRYLESCTPSAKDKNYKAMMNAVDRYEDNIHELQQSGFDCIEIRDMNYDLKDLVNIYLANKAGEEIPWS